MIITWFLSHCQGSDGKQELECMIFEMLLHCSTYDFFLTKPNCLDFVFNRYSIPSLSWHLQKLRLMLIMRQYWV